MGVENSEDKLCQVYIMTMGTIKGLMYILINIRLQGIMEWLP